MTVIITIIEDSYQDWLNIVMAEDVPNVFHVDIILICVMCTAFSGEIIYCQLYLYENVAKIASANFFLVGEFLIWVCLQK